MSNFQKSLKPSIRINAELIIINIRMKYFYALTMFYLFQLTLSQMIVCQKGCAACNSDLALCSACFDSYQLNTQGQCVKSNFNFCSIYRINSEKCSACIPTYRSQNGSCIKDMSGCLDFINQSCSKCGFGKTLQRGGCVGVLNCLAYNQSVCSQCSKGYFLSRNICYTANINCLRIDYTNGACIKCSENFSLIGYQCVGVGVSPKNCYIFDQTGVCLHCKRGYQLSNGSCIIVPKCKLGFYLNHEYLCITLPAGCHQLDSFNDTCIQCNPNHQLANSSCIPTLPNNCNLVDAFGNCLNCTQNYYSSNFSCREKSPFCSTFNSMGKCLKCKNKQFAIIGGLCKDPYCLNMTEYTCLQCRDNFEYSNDSQRCLLLDKNCIRLDYTSCLECASGFYLSFDICKPLPFDCLQASKSGACLNCDDNYYLQFDACYPVNRTLSNCRLYSKITSTPTCQICQLGYMVSLGQCLQIPPFCLLLLSNGNCASCSQGYTLSSKTCVAQRAASNSYCANMVNNTCLRCNGNAVLGINGACYPINNEKCLLNDSRGNCLLCSQYTVSSRGVCLLMNRVDINCRSFNKNQCLGCYQGYYLSNSNCKLPNPNCSTFNSSNGECLSCYSGFTLTNSQCVIMAKITNCVSYDGFGNCLQCAHMYYISSNQCKTVNSLCQNYNPFNGYCTSCFPGFSLKGRNCVQQNSTLWSTITNITAECVVKRGKQCVECPYRYYIRNNICILVSSSCEAYDAKGNCLTCNIGFFLQNHNCINYGALNGSDQNCKIFQHQSFCLECYSGFVAIEGSCESIDPLCKTNDNITGHCTSCYQGYELRNHSCRLIGMQTVNPCLSQDSLGQCTQCIISYDLVDEKCVYNESVKRFNFNIPFCQIGINSSYCSLCSEGFYTRQGYCYQVSSYCQTYNSQTGNCLTCKSGYVFQENTCIYPAMGLDPKCQSYSGVYCSLCVAGYYLKNYICSAIDERCINFNYSINQCLVCSSGTPIFDICQ